MSGKIGRNALCPCQSGKKFKRCHGAIDQWNAELAQSRMALEAREFQRREQQGLGRPIIFTQVDAQRIVAVNRTLHTSKSWDTFHDFLRDYPRIVLRDDWWQDEVRKPKADQHRIVSWFLHACEQAAKLGSDCKELPSTGALSSYMRFAYDLYALQHAVEVGSLLIERIRSPRGFSGAMYEVRVAASLLRAGFTLELEDETSRLSTHVEFVATHIVTGRKFSVEAKRREGAKLNINKLLHSALAKHAEHPRIVFIDTNDPRLEFHRDEKVPLPLALAKRMLKRYADDPGTQALPSAYVIATLALEEHHLDASDLPFSLLLWGFRIDDMQPGLKTLTEEVQTRRRHLELFELMESMVNHSSIPVSFSGEANAYLSDPPTNRLQIGSVFMLPGPEGADVEAVLVSGVVVPEQKQAFCIFRDISGGSFTCLIPITDTELKAFIQHPSTFFGVVDRNAGRKPLETALDCFNFLWESAKDTPKGKLLEFMKGARDIKELSGLVQVDLATIYCVRMAEMMMCDMSTQ